MARPDPAPRGAKFIILASLCVVIAALWFMQDVLIPLALAILVTFLFTPVVHRLERWGLGRIGSVAAVMTLMITVIGVLGCSPCGQARTLPNDLPKYQDEIVEKLTQLKPGEGGLLERVQRTTKEVTEQSEPPATGPATQPAELIADDFAARTDTPRVRSEDDLPAPLPKPLTTQPVSAQSRAALEIVQAIGGPWTKENPFPTADVDPQSPLEKLGEYLGFFLGP